MKYLIGSFFAFFLSTQLSVVAEAQWISITSPTAPQTVAEGDDFATDVLGNAWDFNERRDIAWEENFSASSISVSGGVWQGSNQTSGGYVFPLFPGFAGSLFAERLEGDKSLPMMGINHRINASKYTLLSYRLRHSDRGAYAIYWDGDTSRSQYWPGPESPMRASYDGFYHYSAAYKNSGWNLYCFDMKDSSAFEQKKGTWSGNPYALRLDPSISGKAGAKTEIDWVRLVDPNSAPTMTLRWNSSSLSEFSVITVYVDNNNSGYDGTPIARYTNGHNPGEHTVKTAMLPPGNHYFYVTAQEASGGSFKGAITKSGYSARLTIKPKPKAYFTSPSQITGEDYATTDVGNPWDMDSAVDVPNLNPAHFPDQWRQFTNANFGASPDAQEGKLFVAQADPPWTSLGNKESDVQVHLNVSDVRGIDPKKYRYLTYRMAVDPTEYPTIADKVRRGWVSRPVFWNSDIITDAGRPKAHVVYEGWHTYTIDLWDTSITEQGIPWSSFAEIQNLRIDPLETDVPTWFWIDWVKLSAENRPVNDKFKIEWTLENSGSGKFDVDLYYDTDDSGFNGKKIASLSKLSAGKHSYTWSTTSLEEGKSYYLYLVVKDGTAEYKVYAPVPVVAGDYVRAPLPRSQAPEMDYDGDGKSDHCVYRPSTGTYFQNLSTNGFHSFPWGGLQFKPIHGDFDGDSRADTGLVVDLGGYYYWYIIRSSDGALYTRMWGMTGDDIAIADYNGNGRDEIAVFRAGAWFILDEADIGYPLYWGQAGDVAVPRDYDGDGKDDIAIWRPSDGTWWILNSGYTTDHAQSYYSAIQWGLPGDIPVPGDWTGDGKTDPAVYRPALGMWYIRDVVTGEFTATQWGLPGDIPMVGDYNGDGKLDLTVYREPLGTWYHNYRNGQSAAQQFGLPGDTLPDKAN